MNDRFLLNNGTSFILLNDGISDLLLNTSSGGGGTGAPLPKVVRVIKILLKAVNLPK